MCNGFPKRVRIIRVDVVRAHHEKVFDVRVEAVVALLANTKLVEGGGVKAYCCTCAFDQVKKFLGFNLSSCSRCYEQSKCRCDMESFH